MEPPISSRGSNSSTTGTNEVTGEKMIFDCQGEIPKDTINHILGALEFGRY